MISVPNLRRPLSGSRKVLYILVLCAVGTGCGIFGPAEKRTDDRADPDEVKGSTKLEPVDTIVWNQLPEDDFPPITERALSRATEYKEIYNVALLAPFGARDLQYENDRASPRMVRMIEFLAGVQYGLDHCIKDVRIQLTAIDTEKDLQFKTRFQNDPAVQEADVIIGPYYTDRVEAVSEFSVEHQKILVSPWNTADLEMPNPNYIQLRPSLKTHSKKIADFAKSQYRHNEIMLITKDDQRDIETLTYFQDHPEVDIKDPNWVRQQIVSDIGNSDLTDSLSIAIREDGYRGFIVPVWQDEPFVIAALSKLNFAKGDEQISVFGLPQWMEMSRMDFDYFENLRVHLSSAQPVLFLSKDAVDFKNYYIAKFGDIPGSDAYYGLDVIKWLAGLLKTEGVNILTGLGSKLPGLDFDFNFTALFGEDGESIHHYENQAVHILRFRDYKFEQVD